MLTGDPGGTWREKLRPVGLCTGGWGRGERGKGMGPGGRRGSIFWEQACSGPSLPSRQSHSRPGGWGSRAVCGWFCAGLGPSAGLPASVSPAPAPSPCPLWRQENQGRQPGGGRDRRPHRLQERPRRHGATACPDPTTALGRLLLEESGYMQTRARADPRHLGSGPSAAPPLPLHPALDPSVGLDTHSDPPQDVLPWTSPGSLLEGIFHESAGHLR